MGKKNRKKQDDGDYFASLGAPTENAVDDAAAEKAEEERLARQAKAAARSCSIAAALSTALCSRRL